MSLPCPGLTIGCRRRQTASARASLPLSVAPEPQRSARESRSDGKAACLCCDSMGLSKEGQPCKNSSLAEWHRELWGTEPAREARCGKSPIWQSMITHWRVEPWKDAGS